MLDKRFQELFRLQLVVFFAIGFFACSRVPKGIVPEETMQKVMVDVQLAETMISMDPSVYSSYSEKKALFQSVFDKYDLTEAEYDSSLIWYGKNLEIYMQVYDRALVDVNKSIEKLGDIPLESINVSHEDSVDIWIYTKYYEFTPDAITNLITFDFKPQDDYSSGSIFVLGFKTWGVIPDNQPIDVCIHAIQADSTITVRDQIKIDGYHEFILKTLPTIRVNRVYGYIRLNKPKNRFHKIYLDDFRMLKYKYGSDKLSSTDSTEITQPD